MNFESQPNVESGNIGGAGVENIEKNKRRGTEERLNKVEEVFDDLLEQVKDSPEAKKIALEAAIADMRKIAEQMSHVRDMKSLQELKKLMLEHWKELNDLTKGDKNLMEAVHNWGKDFIDNKVIFYDMINDIKDELTDKSQEIQAIWNKMQIGLGKLMGLLGPAAAHLKYDLELSVGVENVFSKRDTSLKTGSGIESFIESLNSVNVGFELGDIDLDSATQFLARMNIVIRGLAEAANSKYDDKHNPETDVILENLVSDNTELSSKIKECSKIYKVAKKIQDTHFLELYNQSAPEAMAA